MRNFSNTFKILWPYIFCGAFTATVWFVDLGPYIPLSANDIMRVEGVIFAVIVGNILHFSYKGISQPQSVLQKTLLSFVALITLFLSGLLAYKGWLHLEKQKVLFSFAYVHWVGNIAAIFFLPAVASVFVTLISLLKIATSSRQAEEEPYGSARLCSAQEAISKNDSTGLPLGRVLSSVKGNDLNLIEKILSSKSGEIFKFNPVHSFVVAPTRAGKGVGFVIPTLLDYDGPIVTIDPKSAENFAITARHRRKNGSRKVLVFDTGDVTGEETACINIFDFIDIDHPKFIDTVKGFSASLSPTVGDERIDYFKRAAQQILTCLIIHVVHLPKKERNLSTVFSLLSTPPEDLLETFQEIYENEDLAGGTASRAAAKVLSTEQKELSSCINSARDTLDFLDSPAYRHITSKTNFEMTDIFENKADLFFCIPVDEIESHGHYFIRLALSLIVQQIKRLEHPPKKNVLFLLDEMAAIGQIREVKNILLLGAGYGISLMGITQSIEALKKVYPNEIKTMLSSSLVMFLGIRETDDMDYVSKRLGYKTVFSESNSTNEGSSKSKNSTTNSAIKREILTSSEISDLGKKYILAFVEGMKPMVLEKLCYFSDEEFEGKFDNSKFHV